MNRDGIRLPDAGAWGTGPGRLPTTRPASQFHITVIWTTEEGTLAALKAADKLAKHLCAPLTLAMIEVVPASAPLEQPKQFVDFLENRALRVLSDAGIRRRTITLQIWFSRDFRKCLQQALGAYSLAVIGGAKHWWRRDERKLEEWLGRRGYPVVFADVEAKSIEMLPLSQRHAVMHEIVKNAASHIVGSGAE